MGVLWDRARETFNLQAEARIYDQCHVVGRHCCRNAFMLVYNPRYWKCLDIYLFHNIFKRNLKFNQKIDCIGVSCDSIYKRTVLYAGRKSPQVPRTSGQMGMSYVAHTQFLLSPAAVLCTESTSSKWFHLPSNPRPRSHPFTTLWVWSGLLPADQPALVQLWSFAVRIFTLGYLPCTNVVSFQSSEGNGVVLGRVRVCRYPSNVRDVAFYTLALLLSILCSGERVCPIFYGVLFVWWIGHMRLMASIK